MKNVKIFLVVAFACAVVAGAYGLYRMGVNQGQKMTAAGARVDDSSAGKKILYWHDPMVPAQKFDKPGKSPFMDMQLVPVYADDADDGKVKISARMQQNLGIRTAEATKDTFTAAIEAVGSVAYNERDVTLLQARSNGFVERLYVRAPLDPVRKGQPLAELYVPDWVAVQEEYLSVSRMHGAGLDGLADAARQRMRLAGMDDEQIRLVESSGKVHARFVMHAPQAGVVTDLSAREGMTVTAGTPLFRINGIGTVWVNAEVPENLAAGLKPGDMVQARSAALPEAVFKGRVNTLLPEINTVTRTRKARIELANPSASLVPGMFVTVNFTPSARNEVLTVPTEAIIRTGKRSVVIVAQGDGSFTQADVETGMESKGRTEIRKGLDAGLRVVVSGQFLIDSEASLRATESRMGEPVTEGTKK